MLVTAVTTAVLISGFWIAFYHDIRELDPTPITAFRAPIRLKPRIVPHLGEAPVESNSSFEEHASQPPLTTQPLTTARIGKVPDDLLAKHLTIPVPGIRAENLHPDFFDARGQRGHEAIDIMAPRGQPVIATEDGRIAKLFTSVPGGLTIYEFDPTEKYTYYYAHLDRYEDGLAEGDSVVRGQIIGYVGSTGNADELHPHLHFAIFLLGPEKQWWKGEALDPYPALTQR